MNQQMNTILFSAWRLQGAAKASTPWRTPGKSFFLYRDGSGYTDDGKAHEYMDRDRGREARFHFVKTAVYESATG